MRPKRWFCVISVTMPMRRGAIHAVALPTSAKRPKNSVIISRGAIRAINVRLDEITGPTIIPKNAIMMRKSCCGSVVNALASGATGTSIK